MQWMRLGSRPVNFPARVNHHRGVSLAPAGNKRLNRRDTLGEFRVQREIALKFLESVTSRLKSIDVAPRRALSKFQTHCSDVRSDVQDDCVRCEREIFRFSHVVLETAKNE